jgi:hypothetical protein
MPIAQCLFIQFRQRRFIMYLMNLELSKKLSSEEQAKVLGGVAATIVATNGVGALLEGACPVNGGGGGPVSPAINPFPGIPAVVPIQMNPDPHLILASLVASANALLGQPTLQNW